MPSVPAPAAADEALPLYPVFLKVQGRRCVVVGGGPIGAQKAGELLACGAHVTAISPAWDAAWDALASRFGQTLQRIVRTWQDDDATGAMLVVSATADPLVDEAVWNAGHAAGALVNIVDVPHRCDYYAGAIVRSNPVQVLIGTGGASPSLSIALRERITRLLPPTIGVLGETLGRFRGPFRSRFPDYRTRALRLNAAVAHMVDALTEPGATVTAADIERWVAHVLDCPVSGCDPRTCPHLAPLPPPAA